MAISRINMECKRYGCMKNLLACYANCRYSGRCDDLRNEVIDKTDQAAKDINDYLRERGRAPITIQVMKRGLKFSEAPRIQKSLQSAVRTTTSKQVSGLTNKEPAKANKPRLGENRKKAATKRRKRITMARNSAPEEGVRKQEKPKILNQIVEAQQPATIAKASRSKNGSTRKTKGSSRSSQPALKTGKVFIILEGKSASLVDEQGLIAHLLANHSSDARYFEASEVEARLQIVPKR